MKGNTKVGTIKLKRKLIIKVITIIILIFIVPLPCIVPDWTTWSEPDATGTMFRFRMMLRPALNGGKECPDLMELRKGLLCLIGANKFQHY